MKQVPFGKTGLNVPAVAVGCMRFAGKTPEEMERFLHFAQAQGATFFDHADIYGGGKSEEVFGDALKASSTLRREDFFLQSKCGIRKGYYDQSKEYILQAVDGILQRLQTEYLDCLLIHRPDALAQPEEIAEAFDILERSGKVKHFGVSNHNPGQMALLKKCVRQDLQANQLQFSIPVSNMVAAGIEVNMDSAGAAVRDGGVLDYCRLHDITIQAWSPFQRENWQGPFIGSEACPELNKALEEIAVSHGVTPTVIAAAWILRHPANMQIVSGSTSEARLAEIISAGSVTLSRPEWYRLYLAAGHILP